MGQQIIWSIKNGQVYCSFHSNSGKIVLKCADMKAMAHRKIGTWVSVINNKYAQAINVSSISKGCASFKFVLKLMSS